MPERPSELAYALDEKPPWPHLLALGFQHVSVICPYLVMVALVAEAAKLPHHVAHSAIGLAMIAVAFMTIMQSVRLGPVGSGYLCPPVVSAIYLPSSIAAAASFGFPAVCGMVIFVGACEIAVASLINRTRKLFPAVVSGVVIIAVGLELGKIAADVLFQHAAAHSDKTAASFATAAFALATMTGLAVWAKGLPKLLCSLIGILAGYAATSAFPIFPRSFFSDYVAAPFFALPDPSFLSYAFVPSFVVPFAIAGLASGLRVIGALTTCQQMNDAAWRRPDMQNIEAGVRADGVGCLVGGLLGAPGMSASPSLVSIEKTTGATSRVIAWSIAFWLVLLSCLPKFAGLIANMPRPVMAAALQRRLHAGCRHPDCRQPAHHTARLAHCRIYNLGSDFRAGFSGFLPVPSWLDGAVHRLDHFHGSGRFRATQCHLFVRHVALQPFASWDGFEAATARSFDEFFKRQAKDWKVPTEDAARVRSVVDTAIEDAAANANGPVEIQVGSDTFDILVTLRYTGNLPSLPDARPKKEMVEEQSFVSGLTGYLSGLHADRIERSAKGEECEIKLLFRL